MDTIHTGLLWGDLERRTIAVANILSKALRTVAKSVAIVSLSAVAQHQRSNTVHNNTVALRASLLPFKVLRRARRAQCLGNATFQTSGLIPMVVSTGLWMTVLRVI